MKNARTDWILLVIYFLFGALVMLIATLFLVSEAEAQEPGCDTAAFLQMGGNFQFMGNPLEPYVGINAVTEDHAVWHRYIKWDTTEGRWVAQVATGTPTAPALDCAAYFESLLMESVAILNGTLTGYPIYADYDLTSLLVAVREFQSSGIHSIYIPIAYGSASGSNNIRCACQSQNENGGTDGH